jgi:hypothetical protein
MRVFPRINYRAAGVKGLLRRRARPGARAGRTPRASLTLVAAGPLLLLAGGCAAFASLAGDSFVIRRLQHLDSPLGIDPASLHLWDWCDAPQHDDLTFIVVKVR